jgi:hypothetical protein
MVSGMATSVRLWNKSGLPAALQNDPTPAPAGNDTQVAARSQDPKYREQESSAGFGLFGLFRLSVVVLRLRQEKAKLPNPAPA